jgi:hypothetical protein
MASTLGLRQSEFSAIPLPKLSVDTTLDPVDLDKLPSKRASLGTRALRALTRFLITFCIGVAATLAWQSYGDAAREMMASSSPQLGWLAPQATPVVQTAPDTIASAVPSPDLEQLKAMALGLAVMRQSVDQLAAQVVAGQQQMTREITKLQATEQDILQKISAPPLAGPAPARKPVASPAQATPAR